MAEFDDKLNSLLSNPEAMDQIMKMAQSLMGNGGGAEQPPPAAPPSGETGSAVQNGGLPFQQSGPASRETAQSWGQPSPESQPPSPSGPVVSGQPGSGPGFLSGLGDLDPKAIASPPAGPPGAGRGPEQQRPPAFIRTAALSETGAAG